MEGQVLRIEESKSSGRTKSSASRGPYELRDDVPIPRLPPRGKTKDTRIIDDPLYDLMLSMEPGQSFVAPWDDRGKIGNFIQYIRGRDSAMMFITRKIVRYYRGAEILKVGVWRV